MARVWGWLRVLEAAVSDGPRPPWVTSWFVILLILVSVGRITSTYRTFSQVWDEPAHIACGLEWWQNGVYTLEPQHPPLARIFVSALLYFRGVRIHSFANMWSAGNGALTASGRYAVNLASARLGSLPFWIMSCIILFVLARQIYGGAAALLTLLLFSTLPPMLGLAGWAYTDTALVAGMLFFSWRWVAFVDKPGFQNAFWLGLSIGFALLTKYSAIPYILVAAALTAIVAIRRRGISLPRAATLIRAGAVLLCITLTAFFFMWACFRFSLRPISPQAGQAHPSVDQRVGSSGLLHKIGYLALDTPVPLTEVVLGVAQVVGHAKGGHSTYTFGKVRTTGNFYYFPVLLVVTIPAGLLALLVLGGLSFRRAPNGAGVDFRRQVLLTVPVAVLLVNALSSINIGYRHNLAFYPFVCLVGGAGCVFWWSGGRRWVRLLVAVLVGQHLLSSALAHPNYASFFNFLAGNRPEEICVHSIGGGDEWRLASRLRQLDAPHVCLALGPTLPLDALGLPPYTILERNVPCEGWVAIGLYRSHIDPESTDPASGLEWLTSQPPIEKIGTSILLYRVPAPPSKGGMIPQGAR